MFELYNVNIQIKAALDNPNLFNYAKNKWYTTPNTLHRCGNPETPCNADEFAGKEVNETEQVILLATYHVSTMKDDSCALICVPLTLAR